MTFDARSFFPLRPGCVFLILGATIFILFGPIIPTYFVVDDYNFVGELMLRGREYVQGYELHRWFIEFSAQGLQIPELSIFFRPGVHGLWLIDYLFWGTWAPGYHVTNIFLHVLNSFLVYLLALQILRHRAGALVAGFLFALQPIHVTAVALASNRVDLLSAFFYLASALYFVLFRQRSKRAYALTSALLYAGAIGTKESTVALPLILVGYDLLFSFPELRAFTRFQIARVTRGKNFAAESNAPETFSAFRAARQIIVAQIPYALVLVIYVALRFLAFDEFGRNTGGGFLSYGAELFFQFYTLALSEPFVADMNNGLLFSILAAVAIMLAIFRARRAMWFGAGWIAVSLIPATLVANVAPRIAYTPSAGLPLALAAILVQPVARIGKFSRRVGIALVLFLFGAYAWGLSAQVDDWTAVGTVARAVVEETQRLHPTLANDARVYYTGVPDILRGIYIYNDNFDGAIRLAYRAPNLRAARVEKFPIRTDALDRTYFLEYARRKISERTDLVRALETRQRCLGNPLPGIVWDFSQDAQGWQAWNQLSDFQFRDRALTTRALDNDPFMGSPPIDFPAQQLGTIEIEMRVRTDANARGALYWLTAGQIDFSPLQTREFALQTDNAFHRYAVDLAESGQLAFGDRITRLRLDPTDGVGEIEIKSIRVNKWCAENGIGNCLCPP